MTSTPNIVNLGASSVTGMATPPGTGTIVMSEPTQHIGMPVLNKMQVDTSGALAMAGVASSGAQMVGMAQPAMGLRPVAPVQTPTVMTSNAQMESKVLDKRRLQELVKEVDPLEQLDEDVEEVLLQIADDFIESVVTASCQIAKHRKSSTLDVKDVQLHLERNWNMWIPGFGSDELRPYKKATTTEAHKQRMALIRKTLKKS